MADPPMISFCLTNEIDLFRFLPPEILAGLTRFPPPETFSARRATNLAECTEPCDMAHES